jgi:hypothetical protein
MARLLVLVTAALVLPTAGRAQNKQTVCDHIKNHALTVGRWASYRTTDAKQDRGTLRMAVFGSESRGGKTYYWYEISVQEPRREAGTTIVQMLTSSLGGGEQTPDIREIIIKTADQPAMRVPQSLLQMVESMKEADIASQLARQCQEMDLIGVENVTVPAGRFRTFHMHHRRDSTHVWLQPDLFFIIVKSVMKDGALELTAQGTGANSSITETPIDMPGIPGVPPRR